MSIKPDYWIERMAREYGMIEPFEPGQVKVGVVSYGLSSYGYDIRVADEFKIFTNVNSTVVDPKHFDARSFVDFKGDVCTIPPNSFALARTVEYFRIPRNVLTICVGKCLTGDTRVVDAETGDYRPLKDLVTRRGPSTIALENWGLKSKEVTAHINNGVQPVYELTTRAGLRIKATATHPFRTWQGWTALANLFPGERIAVARSCPIFGKSDWPEHEAVLLGLMLADGQCHTPGHSPRYTTGDPRLAEVMTEAAQTFGCEVSPVGRYGYNVVKRLGQGGIVTKNRFDEWLERLGCNTHSVDKFVPSVVFTARREQVAKFLQALFSGDGSVYSSRSGEGLYLEYDTTSERLAYDVRHLLLRFNIFALVRSKPIATGRAAYRVRITDRTMIRRFAEQIGFVAGCRKQKMLDDLLSKEVVNASTFADIVEADVVWDVVKSVVPCGEEVVYDLTVPGVHNFLANDLIVHNSTYARCGIIVNVTPFEPEWEGYVTLEISNTTPLPARIYSNEGIAQVLFFQADEVCRVSYADKQGKYQKQAGITLPHINH